MKRNLFLSFTRTLVLLMRGTITLKDLEGALFYFQCSRWHLFETDTGSEARDGFDVEEVKWYIPTENNQNERDARNYYHKHLSPLFLGLIAAVVEAEKNDRCIWRLAHDFNSYEQLNLLLQANGYKPLDTESQSSYGYDRYECAEKIRASGNELTPVL